MSYSPLLAPLVVLVAWTLVMLVWLAVKRAPYVKDRASVPAGSRGENMPAGPHNWPAHNYTHLLEQPTIFYAIILALALMNVHSPLSIYLAWAYVGLRIVHSFIQATVNIVRWRFLVFALSTACLAGLTIQAGVCILSDCGIIG